MNRTTQAGDESLKVDWELSAQEMGVVDRFRQRKETAVLTIMFTDIKGFTRMTDEKGEEYSGRVRRMHDEVLEKVIRENEAGEIVKHIGDAVMAVFSEPSAAVEKALKIQQGIEEMNRAHPEIDPVEVRIGLDMGQVTVEGQVQVDVFGRHVNRASRVEGLADGGQVYMSYTVFDSARGWLSRAGNEHLKWGCHGRFALKGITGLTEIYEVVDGRKRELKAPEKASPVRGTPKALWAVGLVLLGMGLLGAGVLGARWMQKAEVWLLDYYPTDSYLDGNVKLALENLPAGQTTEGSSRKVLVPINVGKHVLSYDVSRMVRYYSEIDVKRGENYITPRFEECYLPGVYRYINHDEEAEVGEGQGNYFFYRSGGTREDYEARMGISLEPNRDASSEEKVVFVLSWWLEVRGKRVAEESRVVSHGREDEEAQRVEEELYRDDYHRFLLKYRLVKAYAHLEIQPEFVTKKAR